MNTIATDRLRLRMMTMDDADFILTLLNTEGWLRYIGDRKVHTLEQAQDYLTHRVLLDYAKFGFGFYVIERLNDQKQIGTCGLTKREGLDLVDLGFALLTPYEGQGYAFEAASAMLDFGFLSCKLGQIGAITTTDNHRSLSLLNKLGMKFIKLTTLSGEDDELMLYSIEASERIERIEESEIQETR